MGMRVEVQGGDKPLSILKDVGGQKERVLFRDVSPSESGPTIVERGGRRYPVYGNVLVDVRKSGFGYRFGVQGGDFRELTDRVLTLLREDGTVLLHPIEGSVLEIAKGSPVRIIKDQPITLI